MEVVIVPSAEEAGERAAAIVARAVDRDPETAIGFATGSSPLPTYRALARRVADGLDLSGIRGFALDEYVGIAPEHPASYHAVIRHDVVEPLGLDPRRMRVLDGRAADLEAECRRFEDELEAAGGISVQILGIGSDGHIGFNEPSSSLGSRTRVKTLTEQTRLDNARFFSSLEEVPEHCLTQGIGTILEADRLVLVAAGAGKAHAVAAAVEGPLSAFVPASALQLHPDATVIVDEEAAAGLTLSGYYRRVERLKERV